IHDTGRLWRYTCIEYVTSSIRMSAQLGQCEIGNTSLADALQFASGKVNRLGRVDDGSSLFDFEPEETRHKVSISAALHHLPWKKHEVTIVDTPGYASFLSESRQAMRAVDGGVLVLSASGQVKIELQKLWAWAQEDNLGCVGFITHLDREALGEAARQRGDKVAGTVAEASDELLEKYLESGSLTPEEIQAGLRAGVLARRFVPALCGSSVRMVGVHALLDAIVDCLASPVD